MKGEHRGWIELGGERYAYCWTKKQVKNFNLRVRRDGTIALSTPPSVSRGRAESFLLQNENFILSAQAYWRTKATESSHGWSLCHGGRLPILGREFSVVVSEEPPFGVVLAEGMLRIHAPSREPDRVRNALRDWMGRRMEEWMPRLCEEALCRMEQYGVEMPTLKYRCMVSRWGSCCKATGEITFNKFLICVPPRCVEYVVCHELAHLVEANHSAAFYRVLSALMPDWRERREELSPYGALLRKL